MEVTVDPDTGEVEIMKVVNVNDVGKVISWDGCEAQQYGGTYMAVGGAAPKRWSMIRIPGSC